MIPGQELDSLFTAQGLKAPEKAEFKDHSGIVDLFSRPETGIWDMIRNRSMKVTMNDSMFHKQFMTSMSHQARYTGGLLIPITSREAFECGLLTDAMANQEEDIDRATDAEAKTLSHLFVVRHSPGDILYTTSNMLSDNRLRIPQVNTLWPPTPCHCLHAHSSPSFAALDCTFNLQNQ